MVRDDGDGDSGSVFPPLSPRLNREAPACYSFLCPPRRSRMLPLLKRHGCEVSDQLNPNSVYIFFFLFFFFHDEVSKLLVYLTLSILLQVLHSKTILYRSTKRIVRYKRLVQTDHVPHTRSGCVLSSVASLKTQN